MTRFIERPTTRTLRRLSLRCVPVMAYGLVMAFCAGASAQESRKEYPVCEHEPTESDVSAAKGAYKAGQVSFQEADYDRALLYWEDAFRRDCTAVKLLLNIARAYELSGNRPAAVNALTTYLERQPESEDRVSVEKRIAKLNEKIEEEERAAVAAAFQQEQASTEVDAETNEPLPPSEPHKRPFWPVLMTGGGAAVGIAGGVLIYLGATAVADEKDQIANDNGCERDGLDWSCPSDSDVDNVEQDLSDSGTLKSAKAVRTLGYVAAGAGVAATAVGATFWVMLWKKPKSNAHRRLPVWVAPVWSPTLQGLRISGSF